MAATVMAVPTRSKRVWRGSSPTPRHLHVAAVHLQVKYQESRTKAFVDGLWSCKFGSQAPQIFFNKSAIQDMSRSSFVLGANPAARGRQPDSAVLAHRHLGELHAHVRPRVMRRVAVCAFRCYEVTPLFKSLLSLSKTAGRGTCLYST